MCCVADQQITVHVSIDKNIIWDLLILADISHSDFLNCIYAQMNLNHEIDKLGWQTCNVADHAAAQFLASAGDVDQAFVTILEMMKSTHSRKPVFLKIKHLVWGQYHCFPASWISLTSPRMLHLSRHQIPRKMALKCGQHSGDNRWCYINPNKLAYCSWIAGDNPLSMENCVFLYLIVFSYHRHASSMTTRLMLTVFIHHTASQ